MSKPEAHSAIVIAGERIEPGQRRDFQVPVGELPTQSYLNLPVTVFHGRKPGPCLWLSAAIHGDEINGIEIIRNVLEDLRPKRLSGTVIAVPIVNVFGFLDQARELPDGRDLNRSFPGKAKGSLASRLAHLFLTEIVARSTHGIDFHTATHHRTNLPQIRANLEDPETRRIAEAFAAPVSISAKLRDGSLRACAAEANLPVLVYEGGEALRFNARAIARAVEGTRRVLGMLGITDPPDEPTPETIFVDKSRWVRARRAGILRSEVVNGDIVEKGQEIGAIADAFGKGRSRVKASCSGLVIGRNMNPVVHQGQALFHIAQLKG